MIWGGTYAYNLFFGSVTGPFGSIKRSELNTYKTLVMETSEGNMTFELDTDNTPKTAANFVLLAQKNYFNGMKFHRIIKDFMIQSGDPNSKNDDPSDDGMGGPGYQFDDEKIIGEYVRGTLAMANSGPNTNGSQFFIVHKDTEMPKNYVIFGKLIDGFDTLDKIADTPVEDNGTGEKSRPTRDVIINNIVLSDLAVE
ncbi:peptidylprolyl isomerase [candidate division Kazan bacterium]|uniref:Peptidyl-prolyl cis-trans isomerase n=1 Tax=candidate division Kazan bacterium TaxID=2202143 RepID=A0A420ZD19_UNCK3|nr:MAG: peptidylprolyl isomerase [candidate division Kazan bacterium]